MTSVAYGLVAGVAFGAISVGLMGPLRFPVGGAVVGLLVSHVVVNA